MSKRLKDLSRNWQSTLIFVGGFAFVGATLLIATKAAGPSAWLEPESSNSVVVGPATKVTGDSTASNNGYVKFATGSPVSATNPCVGAPKPAQWKHIIVLMFENKRYTDVIPVTNNEIGTGGSAPYITALAKKCGTSINKWNDGDFRVDGTREFNSYNSKPSYGTLTSGVSPSVSGITDNDYNDTTTVNNIYKQLIDAGKQGKNYYTGSAASSCTSARFSGDYHDAIRFYIPTIGQSYCNSHDAPISTFMNDVNGTLAEFVMILPTNQENMHDNSVASGDTWAKNFLDPLFNSARYKSGDTAVFFLWDEDSPIPNVLAAPSIKPGSKVPTPTGNPISHFSAVRTFDEMLGLPLLGVSGQAPSLLNFFNGE